MARYTSDEISTIAHISKIDEPTLIERYEVHVNGDPVRTTAVLIRAVEALTARVTALERAIQ